jgi:hypothetical protein
MSRETWTPETETPEQAESRVKYRYERLLWLLPTNPPHCVVKAECECAIKALNLLIAASERAASTPERTAVAGSETLDQSLPVEPPRTCGLADGSRVRTPEK